MEMENLLIRIGDLSDRADRVGSIVFENNFLIVNCADKIMNNVEAFESARAQELLELEEEEA